MKLEHSSFGCMHHIHVRAEWKRLVHIKENLSEMDYTIIQQMTEARPGKKKGETVKDATKVVEERRDRFQEQQKHKTTISRKLKNALRK